MVDSQEANGRGVVMWMYLSAVAVAGIFGYVLGIIIYGNGGPSGPLTDGGPAAQYGKIGPIVFELNPPNLAIFGLVAVGGLLGLGLLAISHASRYDDATARQRQNY
ncbi:hypothetical protein ABSL23_17190 (plasmid) [Halobacterium sp. NMX12-1]|jgi:hypothetical protein|uniref:Cox cluster protein n=1 Tax=Halobacterium sp. NMX12-1 TaxID=3166650 RepID=A0AAU8CI15_9EURY